MPPLSKVLQEVETVAGDLFESMPSIGQIITKIDPHLTAVDQIVDLAPRLEAVVTRLEELTGTSSTASQEPPAPAETAAKATAAKPIEVAAPAAKPEPAAEADAPAVEDPEVTIKVPASQAAALGKTPITISAPGEA
jgi:hypothetical protein